jgi:hypothetical protein
MIRQVRSDSRGLGFDVEMVSGEAEEAARAFFEKRKPRWGDRS